MENKNTIKLTESEINSLNQLHTKSSELITNLGANHIDLMTVTNLKTLLEDQWNKHIKSQQDLMTTLGTKYGQGTLNLADGTITPPHIEIQERLLSADKGSTIEIHEKVLQTT